MPLRVAFAGTPPFAARALEAIAAAGHDVSLVLTQPDRPAGRGLRLAASAVARRAQELGIPVLKPPSLRQGEAVAALRSAAPEVLVVVAYGLILPAEVLEIAPRGCLNIHASLLPRWRGAAPIQRALLAGDALTGVSIMRMDAGLDTGPVLLDRECAIGPRDTTGKLTVALAELGAAAIVDVLAHPGSYPPREQSSERATYAPKISKSESRIDWARSSLELDRLVRAFDPAPGAQTALENEVLKIWEARPAPGSGGPGEVIECEESRLVIACGTGALEILQVQRPGGKRLAIADFLRGTRVTRGVRLVSAPSEA